MLLQREVYDDGTKAWCDIDPDDPHAGVAKSKKRGAGTRRTHLMRQVRAHFQRLQEGHSWSPVK